MSGDHADTSREEGFVPRVILVTPCYGQVASGWVRTLRFGVRDASLVRLVKDAQSNSSVLTKSFNELLAVALDCREGIGIGEGVAPENRPTHLAMAHSDIVAESGWLDVLWSEMWLYNLDLISAVVPIKGPTGRTSTAIGSVDDPWKVHRCIFDKDRRRYPPTFGAEHVCAPGEVLLVNTGLFLADLRRPFWDDFAFTFHDRIRRTPSGRVAENRSEDWEMSHFLHKVGARYMATWKPRLRHEGINRWPNYEETMV